MALGNRITIILRCGGGFLRLAPLEVIYHDEDIYVTKEIYKAEQENILNMIEAVNKRVDDLHSSINHYFFHGGKLSTTGAVTSGMFSIIPAGNIT